MNMFEQLAGPDKRELAVAKRESRVGASELNVREALPAAPQRLRGDVDANRSRSVVGKRRSEFALGATEIQHSLARCRVCKQERQPQLELLRRGALGHSGPNALEVVHPHRLTDRTLQRSRQVIPILIAMRDKVNRCARPSMAQERFAA
jgi:hypothetical protein